MPTENVKQEEDFEVVDLTTGATPQETTEPRGYEYYARKAEEEAAKLNGDADLDKGAAADETDSEGDESPEVPSKFKGKTTAEIIEAYTQLESEFGRRGNELGQLRKYADKLLELNEPKTEAKAPEPVTVDTLLESPEEAIKKVIENDPTIRSIKDKAVQSEIATAKAEFEGAHPEWETTLRDEAFINWVVKNPLRKEALVRADQQYDYVTAKALFDDYAETHGRTVADATQERNDKARAAAKAAATEAGGNVNASTKKKKFRRADLINLKINNPQRYEAMKDEIYAAYQNGDVI